jgi:membrane protease subunit HflC
LQAIEAGQDGLASQDREQIEGKRNRPVGRFAGDSHVQKFLRYLLAFVVILVLVSFTVTFTVRFTEAAVVTTFGRAAEGDVKRDAGLYFKWPYPIQSITKYDTRVRLFTLKVETQQTRDNRQIAVETFATWRVSDPLKFFQTFRTGGERADEHYAAAEQALRANLRAAAGVVSNYSMEDLFTTASGQSKLPELEAKMLETFRRASDQQGSRLADYGIEAVDVGLTRILLPEEVTRAVFDRMKATRERLAKEIETQGQSQAEAIRTKAKSDAERITSFAQSLADRIRTQGDKEAVPYIEKMNQMPELAVFMANMEFIRKIDPRTSTLVVPSDMPGIGVLMPDALSTLKPGQIPSLSTGGMMGAPQQPAAQPAPRQRPASGGTRPPQGEDQHDASNNGGGE